MRGLIFFSLFVFASLFVIIVESADSIIDYIKLYSYEDRNIINSNEHVLKVSRFGKIYDIEEIIVWKGTYDGIPVAIKITTIDNFFNQELGIIEALNITNNEDAESHRIPQVYYSGIVFGKYKAIAMSLFDETIEDRFEKTKQPFSDFSILQIFRQAVVALKYLNSKQVLHNDIKPENIFLRGPEAFVADFDLSTKNGIEGQGWTPKYGPSNKFADLNRCAMDDLESLIYSLWFVAGFEFSDSCGKLLLKEKMRNKAESWMKKICKRFRLEITRKAFEDICIKEILSGAKEPRYDRIIALLSNAIAEITRITGQTEFEWLSRTSRNSPQKASLFSCCIINKN